MSLRHKNCARLKQPEASDQEDETGRLTLIISTDGRDDEGDVVEQEWVVNGTVPFLYLHQRRETKLKLPLGHVTNIRVRRASSLDVELSEDAERVTLADIDFDPDDEFAQAVRRKYLRGDIGNASVGFDPVEMEEFDDDEPGRFHFLVSALKEVSAVPVGANSDTQPLLKDFDPEVLPRTLRLEMEGNPPDQPSVDKAAEAEESEASLEEEEPANAGFFRSKWPLNPEAFAKSLAESMGVAFERMGLRGKGEIRTQFKVKGDEVVVDTAFRSMEGSEQKEGRRNAKQDEQALEHAREMIDFVRGEVEEGDLKGCPFETQEGDHSEMAGEPTASEGGTDGEKGQDGLIIEGEKLEVPSEQPDDSSGDDSEVVEELDELFAHQEA